MKSAPSRHESARKPGKRPFRAPQKVKRGPEIHQNAEIGRPSRWSQTQRPSFCGSPADEIPRAANNPDRHADESDEYAEYVRAFPAHMESLKRFIRISAVVCFRHEPHPVHGDSALSAARPQYNVKPGQDVGKQSLAADRLFWCCLIGWPDY